MKASIKQEIRMIYIYAPNNRLSKMNKAKTDKIKGRYRYLYNDNWRLQYLAINNRYKNQAQTSKEKEALKNTINQLDLTVGYKTLYPTKRADTFFTKCI